jgi:alkanesulfonate monooxygenase SsuD/methylene tetrahydromethanopterin reductase-like flavin-dependent oxidoreductase (luciferase family)
MAKNPKRPIRFGLIASGGTAAELIETAKSAEQHGFSSVALNDHFNSAVAPLLGLQAMAAATSLIRIATAVLNQDLRHPAVLANELATLDVLSGGRLELGLGAGWVRAEYDQSGIPFDSAAERIERLEENIDILKGLFSDDLKQKETFLSVYPRGPAARTGEARHSGMRCVTFTVVEHEVVFARSPLSRLRYRWRD